MEFKYLHTTFFLLFLSMDVPSQDTPLLFIYLFVCLFVVGFVLFCFVCLFFVYLFIYLITYLLKCLLVAYCLKITKQTNNNNKQTTTIIFFKNISSLWGSIPYRSHVRRVLYHWVILPETETAWVAI